jgi:hypothetical protein
MVDIALWVVQLLTAVLFLGGAYVHAVAYEQWKARMVWLSAVGRRGALVIAIPEALGAIGLVLPLATNTLVWLTPIAALGLALLMLCAVLFHITRREWTNIIVNAVLGALAAFVAFGRWDLLGR